MQETEESVGKVKKGKGCGERRRCDERMRGKIKGSKSRKKSQTVLEKAEKVSLVKTLPKLAFKVLLAGGTEK